MLSIFPKFAIYLRADYDNHPMAAGLLMDPRNLGRFFEQRIYMGLKSMKLFDKIYYEDDLKKIYGWRASSIDYMLEMPDGIILMQVKWRTSRRRENNAIMNFLNSIRHSRKGRKAYIVWHVGEQERAI